MPFISPAEIAVKAEKAYSRFLARWIRGEQADFFPWKIPARLTPDSHDPKATIVASEKLWAHSKAQRGWGYTVHRQQIRSRDFGKNWFPKSITVDTLEDFLRLARCTEDFAATQHVVERVRSELPQLEAWLISSVRSLWTYLDALDDLIRMAQFFMNNPRPDCYARQIPVSVDTKFVERHEPVLHRWLDILLPDSAIDVNEPKFSRRFGLRDHQPHRGVRLLDSLLLEELGLPWDELSLPFRSIASLSVQNVTIVIVENRLNLITLPLVRRGLGIEGEGKSVTRLERVPWLESNRVIYWGDLDVDGFLILSSLRNLIPQVESIMMDQRTMQHNQAHGGEGNGTNPSPPSNLTTSEASAFAVCSDLNWRLEQEKIPQPYVDRRFEELLRERRRFTK